LHCIEHNIKKIGGPKISVVMSIYNAAQYLREAIDSILAQTSLDLEFIIINDGSNDSSSDIIKSYKDPRIIFLENKSNIGLPKSLNKGIKIAKGNYIARQDADDISIPGRLKYQCDYLDNNPDISLVGSWWEYIDLDSDTFQIGQIANNDNLIKKLLIENNIKFPHGSVMLRKSSFNEIGGYDERFRFTQDLDLWLRMSKIFNFACIELPLYKWRVSPSLNTNKIQAQEHFRNFAYKKFFTGTQLTMPKIDHSYNQITISNNIWTTDYSYQIGIRAISNGYWRIAIKCILQFWSVNPILPSVKFSLRILILSLKWLLNKLIRTSE